MVRPIDINVKKMNNSIATNYVSHLAGIQGLGTFIGPWYGESFTGDCLSASQSKDHIKVDRDPELELQPIWRKELFAIHYPFMMDSQAERIKRENMQNVDDGAVLKETSAQRKRRKKSSMRKHLSSEEEKIISTIKTSLPLLVERARELKLLKEIQCALHETDNNKSAQLAASVPGCGDMFSDICHNGHRQTAGHIHLQGGPKISLKAHSLVGVPVLNTENQHLLADIEGHRFVIPPHSCFLMSSFHHLLLQGIEALSVDSGYDLIVMDPPWANKSVKRKTSYNMLDESELLQIPISALCKTGCLVCIWVTNNSRLIDFVQHDLFTAWGVTWLADWIWVKVTTGGEPVTELTSPHKKPYEQLLIGRYKASKDLGSAAKKAEVPSQNFIKRGVSYETGNQVLSIGNSALKEFVSPCIATDSLGVSDCEAVESSIDCPTKETEPMRKQNQNDDSCEQMKNSVHNESESLHASCLRSNFSPTADKELEIPNNFLLASVPCALHSKKPFLGASFCAATHIIVSINIKYKQVEKGRLGVLKPFLPREPKCLEMFARNLNTGWTSWGNEPLRHQHIDYFEEHENLVNKYSSL